MGLSLSCFHSTASVVVSVNRLERVRGDKFEKGPAIGLQLALDVLPSISVDAIPTGIFGIDLFPYFERAVEWAKGDGLVPTWILLGLVLAATGIGFPSPEDIPLTLMGFLTYQSGFFGLSDEPGVNIWFFVLATAFAATCNVTGDIACYWAGRKWGLSVRDRFRITRRLISDRALLKVEGWYMKYGNATVFIGRLIAGVRLVTFFTAGAVKMPFRKFVLWDYLGCTISVPVWLALGAYGASVYNDAEAWQGFREWFNDLGGYMLLGGLTLLGSAVVYFKFIRKSKSADDPEEMHERADRLAHELEERIKARESQRVRKVKEVRESGKSRFSSRRNVVESSE